MSTTVTTKIQHYTWDNIPHTWNSCDERWDECGVRAFEVNTTEVAKITCKQTKFINKYSAEQFAAKDNLSKKDYTKSIEKLSVSEQAVPSIKMQRMYTEFCKILEQQSSVFAKRSVEPVQLTDSSNVNMIRVLKDSIGVSETYWDNILFFMNVCENMTLREAISRAQDKNTIEKLLVGEHLYKVLASKVKESIVFQDELKRHALFVRVVQELFSTTDMTFKTANKQLKESVQLLEEIRKITKIAKQDQAKIIDNFSRKFMVQLHEKENLSIVDFIHKEMNNNYTEACVLYDTIIQACEAVMSNIYAAHGDLDLNKFLEIVNTPPGFTTFTDFKVGEYEYQEALVRILIKASVPQSQPSVSDVVMHVDIPDTDDRGTERIVDISEPTKIYYNKHYYNSPEVNVIVIGGNTSDGIVRPNLISTDGIDDRGRYFTVEIINENGKRVVGTISWFSKGY